MIEQFKLLFQKLPVNKRIDLYGFLSTLVQSGKDLQDAAGQVAQSLESQADEIVLGKGGLLKSAKLYRYLESEQRYGNPLHVSLMDRVPDAEIMMLLAGEEGSRIEGLNSAQISARRSAEMKKKLTAALTYPTIVLCVVVFAMHWLGGNLIPTMEELKPVSQWSRGEQLLHYLTTNVPIWFPLFLIGLGTFIGIVMLVNAKVVGPAREKITWLPPFNVIRKVTAATYLGTLASLVKAGSNWSSALNAMKQNTTSPYLGYYLDEASIKMRSGVAKDGPGRAISSNLFSPWVKVKLDIYSRDTVESFTESMKEISDDAQQEALTGLGRFASFLNLIFLATGAVVVGYTILTMLGITQSLQQ
ncbi:type II secretion system F family protein [Marinobacter salarius]|uniref:General secretion pathway protein F n=1 Tax=Marinobacter salarius TaxID=1420917 RepID=A0A1W6KFU3_9GAMM|nr:type II secretion system F family protein [Marinobacter salarius]ARM86294.1 toxin coregulated pilus biosynthesis protein E [Marinobacter salarius]